MESDKLPNDFYGKKTKSMHEEDIREFGEAWEQSQMW